MAALIFDVEAVGIENAADYMDAIAAPVNYKDEVKIAAYIAQAQQEQLDKAALDIDLARIVAIGAWDECDDAPSIFTAKDEREERVLLKWFWGIAGSPLIGFNCVAYDLPLLLRRSLYLGVAAPTFTLGKYRHPGIEDLILTLSFDGALRFRSLSFYAKRFKLTGWGDDTVSGKDIPKLVAAGEWEQVTAHCRADVLKTAALARRIGLIAEQEQVF
jgi:predicted PolB exonuclease-like 3'-5' exonuclease